MKYDGKKAGDYAKRYWNTACGEDAGNDGGVYYAAWGPVRVMERRRDLRVDRSWSFRFQRDKVPNEQGSLGESAVFLKNDDLNCYDYDGRIIATPWSTAYKAPDGKIHPGGLDDCTNFASMCLLAGGADIQKTAGAPVLVNQLLARSDVITLGEKLSISQGQKIIDSESLRIGDIISYFSPTERKYTHNCLYIGRSDGNGRIACHTVCRYPGLSVDDARWDLGHGDLQYTFFRFPNANVGAAQGSSRSIEGWWKAEASSSSNLFGMAKNNPTIAYYQYNYPTGQSYRTSTPPKGPQTKLHAGTAGHWLPSAGGYTVVWRSTGDVDIWSGPYGGNILNVNGVIRGTVTRLFKPT